MNPLCHVFREHIMPGHRGPCSWDFHEPLQSRASIAEEDPPPPGDLSVFQVFYRLSSHLFASVERWLENPTKRKHWAQGWGRVLSISKWTLGGKIQGRKELGGLPISNLIRKARQRSWKAQLRAWPASSSVSCVHLIQISTCHYFLKLGQYWKPKAKFPKAQPGDHSKTLVINPDNCILRSWTFGLAVIPKMYNTWINHPDWPFVKAAGPETHTEKYKVHMNIYVSEEYFPGTEFTKHYSEKKKKSMLLFFKNTKEL